MKGLKINIIWILGLSFSLCSCLDSFLDTDSKTSVTDENFYKTPEDAEMALVGCYDGYQRTVSDGGIAFYFASEILSDNCFGGTGSGDTREYQVLDRFDISEFPSNADLFNVTWKSYYAGIYRCNMLLSRLDDIDFGEDTATPARIEGETRFLRAIMYFDMVRLFERIPLLTEPTTDNIPQAEPEEVYSLIVADLLFAANHISASAYPKSKAADNDGRVTPYAAKALLARVYLFYTGYYGKDDLAVTKTDVLKGLEDIIASEEYALVPEFKSLWPAASYIPDPEDNTLDRSEFAGKGNEEIVFAQKFNNTHNYNGMVDGNMFIVMMGLRNTNYSPYGQGWGGATVNPVLVRDFSDTDKRKTASIIDIAGEGIYNEYDVKDQREYTGYMVKKYTPTALPDGTPDVGGENDFMTSQDQDYYVIRYADVLLMAAELGATKAQDYYDAVRKRAGLSTRTVSLANIHEERRFEFAFEGLRYWDLLRQGLNVAAATIAQTQTVLTGGVDEQIVIAAENIIKTRGFMQIPGRQITLSAKILEQNPGW